MDHYWQKTWFADIRSNHKIVPIPQLNTQVNEEVDRTREFMNIYPILKFMHNIIISNQRPEAEERTQQNPGPKYSVFLPLVHGQQEAMIVFSGESSTNLTAIV